MARQARHMSVLFDSGPLGTGTLFRDPDALIEAWQPADVADALQAMETAQSRGHWLAGSASYELGYVLIPKIAAKLPPTRQEPLLRFGVFKGPEVPDRNDTHSAPRLGPFTPVWQFADYERAFRTVHGFLQSGDIYQANLTFPMTARFKGSVHDLYQALARRQPVPHGALVDLGEPVLLSRSPELFFSISKSGQLRVRPMKGTMRRGAGPEEDASLKARLAASEKDQAENLMITDLMRNDLGRISEIGSVQVPKLFHIESYATVHQMTSEVVAQIKAEHGLADIFKALFPCGSITGAPKIRAMEILSDLEQGPRGPYCGAIGWVAPDGAMAFNVAIRTLICTASGEVTLNVGGGIVFDSTADDEYREALLKARFVEDLT
ncbi:aminodeoxychorismate synthase component I [Gymnodinialimonas sp. 2305UL16-5]|uniref:aminodeoxychorismate synthase component I n=1 Tax=Gymnodinialimonas mytili TaxID=3126503 RepID=UPI0030B414AC